MNGNLPNGEMQESVAALHVHGVVVLVGGLPQSMWLNLMMHTPANGWR